MITFDPAAPIGRQYSLDGERHLSQNDVVSILSGRGYSIRAAHRQTVQAKLASRKTGDPLADFLATCYPVRGALILFADFYERFVASLPEPERYAWTKHRLTRSLPAEHPCGAGTNNKRFIANLSWAQEEDQGFTYIIHEGQLRKRYDK